jgi:hypothetical protein
MLSDHNPCESKKAYLPTDGSHVGALRRSWLNLRGWLLPPLRVTPLAHPQQ